MNVALGVLLVDILLSGDNAIVIAMVCRTLSKQHRTKALWLGVLGAFFARLVLTSCATLAMHLPLIKLIGGMLLLKISVDLIVDNAHQDPHAADPQQSSPNDIFSAARTIVLADIVMSLDNVLALSAITQNNWQMLVAGLLLSIPILMFGSLYLSRLLDVFPYLLWVGGAILGGVSGALIVDDPIFDCALSNASSMAPLFVPIIAAGFVVQISRVIGANSQRMQSVRKPASLFNIFWAMPSEVSITERSVIVPILEVPAIKVTPHQTAVIVKIARTDVATPPSDKTEQASTRVVPAPPSTAGEHRLLIWLGMFMVVVGGLLYYMLNVYQPIVPNSFISYICKQPAMTISYMPEANEIRFATGKGVIKTTAIEGRIVWDDYQEASAKLAITLPVKIISVDARKLIVNGGMFENTACFSSGQ